jgi:hypothetical protein
MKTEFDTEYKRAAYKCYWLFRWGYQRMLLKLRYKKFETIAQNNELADADELLADAKEAIVAARFACRYGKPGNSLLREFASYLEEKNVVTKPELRRLIQSGNLGQNKKERVCIKPPNKVKFGGILFVFFSAVAIVLFSCFIPGIPTSLHYKITLLLIYCGVLFCGTYVFRFYTVQPYKTLKVLPHHLEAFLNKKNLGDKLVRLIH